MTDSYVEMEAAKGSSASLPSPPATEAHSRGFRVQVRAFQTMALPYFREQVHARWLFVSMLVLTLLNSGVRVVFSYLARDFWSALADRQVEEFYKIMKHFLIALLILGPINVYYRFQRQKLAIHWRNWMTDRVLQLYVSNRVYYNLERREKEAVDNPDQRIAEDVRSFTEFSLTFFLTIVMAVIDLVCFAAILFSIMPQLFLSIVSFAAVGTVATIIIGRVLIRLNFEKLRKEANFRYSLVRIRENAESIAFLSGEDVEGREASSRFARVIENMHALNVATRNLDFFTTYYTYLTWILPILVVAPRYFSGAVELGVIQQAAASFSHVLDDLSILITQWDSLSEFSAGIDRLFTFLNVIRALDPDRPDEDQILALPSKTSSEVPPYGSLASRKVDVDDDFIITLQQMSPMQDANLPSSSTALEISNLYVATPDDRRRVLVRDLTLSVKWGQSLLIVGESGAGKSSLLRAIAGLWDVGRGTIVRPSDQDVYFLPQKPYCALGSLRDQLLYPSIVDLDPSQYPPGHRLSRTHELRKTLSDDNLLEILRAVDLAELPERVGFGDPYEGLNTVLDWSNTLSLGEQQRLAFGRLLVNRPHFLIADESTSALDTASESRMYTLLKGMSLTYVSVGHRPTLTQFHDTKLTLSGEHCKMEEIPVGPAE